MTGAWSRSALLPARRLSLAAVAVVVLAPLLSMGGSAPAVTTPLTPPCGAVGCIVSGVLPGTTVSYAPQRYGPSGDRTLVMHLPASVHEPRGTPTQRGYALAELA